MTPDEARALLAERGHNISSAARAMGNANGQHLGKLLRRGLDLPPGMAARLEALPRRTMEHPKHSEP